MSRSTVTLLDACSLVNVYATRMMGQILACVGDSVGVADMVVQEAQYVLRGGDGDDAKEREPINLNPFIASGILHVISTTNEEELLTFIDLTQVVDQGEALTAALAIHRGYTIVTDDRKATRVISGYGVTIRTTIDLIRTWTERQAVPADVARSALLDLRQRGRYEPAHTHPLREWWDHTMEAK
jgi:hypothetical protein